MSKNSSMVTARWTPCWRNMASKMASVPASAAVCEAMAAMPASVRPTLRHTTGFAPGARQRQRGGELRAVAAALEIDHDDGGAGILGEIGHAVGDVDVALVAGCEDQAVTQRAVLRHLVGDAAEGAALGDEADASGRRQPGAEGEVEGRHQPVGEINEAHAVGPEEAHAGAARQRLDFRLRAASGLAHFGEAGGEEHDGAHA